MPPAINNIVSLTMRSRATHIGNHILVSAHRGAVAEAERDKKVEKPGAVAGGFDEGKHVAHVLLLDALQQRL